MNETRNWTWHILAAVLIFVFLGLHMIVMHLDGIVGLFTPVGVDATEWMSVVARSKDLFFAITYVVLLGAVLYHGLYGLRSILFEFGFGRTWQRAINVAFWLGGLGLFAVGVFQAVWTYASNAGAGVAG
jgi:succinate dehydrogenase/fumarate reductase cytochrome b subunit